jgi:hypothetical protein
VSVCPVCLAAIRSYPTLNFPASSQLLLSSLYKLVNLNMADPLSIASGVAGLVSLGLTLCGGLHNYFSNVKGRHQDIETASRSLTLLQSNIFIIQSSTLKLGHRHALSANGVNQGLANCEFELVALQQLMLNLTRDEGLSDITGKLRK